MDLRGHRAVLLPAAIVSSVPLVVIALAPEATPVAVLAVLAALAGMTHPPVSGATRALWPDIVPPSAATPSTPSSRRAWSSRSSSARW